MRRLFISLVWLYFAAMLIGPVAYLSVQAFGEGLTVFLNEVTRPEAVHGFWLTAEITIIVLLFNIVFGTVTAMVLARQRFRGQTILSGLIDLPFSVSPVITGFMLILLLGPGTILGTWFGSMEIKILYALPAMILVTLFVTFPFVVRELTPILMAIGTDSEEAARTLGANEWQIFLRVTLPAIRWGMAYGATLTIARAIGEFGAVLVVSGNILQLTQTATLHIYQSYVDFNYVGAYAVAAVLLAVSFLILIVLELVKARSSVMTDRSPQTVIP
ncbi:MAG TPA: sulfate ABC transporter permease subunit [Nitrospiraceae bacterium]|nr:sulfate ABC transporter permease subunit [Nitrospiraceae bacterium]